MTPLAYPADVAVDESDAYIVTFPDFGYGVTQGDSLEDALGHAGDLLLSLVSATMADNDDLPTPSPAAGRPLVTLPPLAAAKATLYRAMKDAKVSKSELARRLGWQYLQVVRLFDTKHASRLDQIEQALRALGKTLVIGAADAA